MRDSMLIYRSFFEAIKGLKKEEQADVWNAIYELGLNGNEVKLSGLSESFFLLIKPQILANLKRFENGKKPKLKQTESKVEAKPKQKISKVEANNNNNNNNNNIYIPETAKNRSLENWITYRKEIKKKLSEASINNLRKIIADKPDECVEWVVNESITNGWQGLFWDNYKEKPIQKKSVDDLYAENVMKQYEENLRRNDTTGRT
jgi:hypothetical protein